MTRFEHSAPSQSATAPTLGHYSETEWDITSGVGFTALAVAAARAMESQRPDRLMTDPRPRTSSPPLVAGCRPSGRRIPRN